MTRAESLDKAWRLAAKEKDFSLVDELYHAEYKSIGGVSGAELNFPALKEAFLAIAEHMIMGPYKTIDENEKFLRITDTPSTEKWISSVRQQVLSPSKMEKSLIKRQFLKK